jgi:hypothetical protein
MDLEDEGNKVVMKMDVEEGEGEKEAYGCGENDGEENFKQ